MPSFLIQHTVLFMLPDMRGEGMRKVEVLLDGKKTYATYTAVYVKLE